MLGNPAAPAMAAGGGGSGRGLWPLQPAPLPTAVPASQHIQSAAEGYTRFGVYSLFPGAGSPAPGVGVGALYSHSSAAIGRFPTGQASSPGQAAGATFHTTHKVTDSLFSTSNYTFGAPTPPPGSPYSPVPVSQLELLAKGITTSIAAAITQAANINSNTLPIFKHAQAPTGAALTPSHGGSDIEEARGLCSKDRCWSTSGIKSEKNASQSQICACSKATTKFSDISSGCSRTNPVEWTPSTAVHIKREPITPCQVAEVTTSDVVHMNTQKIKIEAEDCTTHSTKHDFHITVPSSVSNGNIPVGIAIARQRLQQDFTTNSNMGVINSGISTQSLKNMARVSEIEAGMAAVVGGGTAGGGGAAFLQCSDDRAPGLAAWPMGGTGPNSTLATPTLWQYPAPMSVEPMLPLPIPMGSYGIPMGFQLIRDPSSGHFLLIPTTSLEQLQQAVVWPSYPQPSSHVILPPLPPPPLAPLQLLSSATSADYLATSTTLHQHTQTHSTRLVAVTSSAGSQGDLLKGQTRSVGAKTAAAALSVPIPLPLAHTLIKIEADCTATATSTATMDHTKVAYTPSEQSVMSTAVPPPGLLATHVFYQHPASANIIISQAPPTSVTVTTPTVIETTIGGSCKSQATSPVTCLTPPPENLAVQDAGNQTELLILDETPHVVFESEPTVAIPELIQTHNNMVEDIHILPTEEIIIPREATPPPTKLDKVEKDVKPILEMICFETPEKVQENCKPRSMKLPDISGLELLSNSIVEFENSRHCSSVETTPIKFERRDDSSSPVPVLPRLMLGHSPHKPQTEQGDEVLKRIAHMTLKDREIESTCSAANATEVDDNLGGLGLLCALAEQRFMEEVGEREKDSAKKEKRKIRHVSIMEPKMKRFKYNDMTTYASNDEIRENEKALERERLSVLRRVAGQRGLGQDLVVTNDADNSKLDESGNSINTVNNSNGCSCKDDNWAKNRKEDNNNTINNNNQPSNTSTVNPDWSPAFISKVERDMRQQLADLQRQYKEKQIELSKLHPKKLSIDSLEPIDAKKPIRAITPSSSPSPPLLDKMDSPVSIRVKTDQELLKPPTLCAVSPPKESIKQSGSNINHNSHHHHHHDSHKRKHDSSEDRISSSKKRKVGRPKKRLSGLSRTTTETIVAKKPRAKAGLVGYLLAAKSRLQMQQHRNGNNLYPGSTPPRYSVASPTASPVKNKKNKHHKEKKNGAIKLTMPDLDDSTSNKYDHRSKTRPQLKAEPTVKTLPEEEVTDNEQDEVEPEQIEETEEESECGDEKAEDEETEVSRRSETVSLAPEEDVQNNLPTDIVQEEPTQEPQIKEDSKCILTDTHLLEDKLRVLTAMGGLFYAGQLTAVSAPDLYAITLDGERGNRPHIMSREEILRDAIVEVSPSSTDELFPGTRLCAYWSQQYRCLYPGTVAEPGTPDPQLDLKFVCVEFDDGDSGRIALEDIRLLPAHYPIIEYDPNPLLSLSKRRRRNSVNSVPEEKRPKSNIAAPIATQQIVENKPTRAVEEKENTDINRPTDLDAHRERKRLKKRRKEKLKKMMCHEDKKKRKKHRCCDEHCKHRKHHKKHRKHRKHHHRNEEENQEKEDNKLVILQEQHEEEVVNNESVEEEEESIVAPVVEESKNKKSKKKKERRESVESRSKMAAFLPARQLWGWCGKGYKRVGVRGRARKQFFKAIQRGKESITVGDCAVFLSTGRPDRPYIGKIEAMWEAWGTNMVVRVKWFYHPEETVGCPLNLKYPGALFESPHVDENDVQTISHKCEVLPLKNYTDKLGTEPKPHETIYDNNDTYYLSGYYDPINTALTMEPGIPFTE